MEQRCRRELQPYRGRHRQHRREDDISRGRITVRTVAAIPTAVVFTPAADYATNVTSYSVELRRATDSATASPVASRNIGNPAIVSGTISVDIRRWWTRSLPARITPSSSPSGLAARHQVRHPRHSPSSSVGKAAGHTVRRLAPLRRPAEQSCVLTVSSCRTNSVAGHCSALEIGAPLLQNASVHNAIGLATRLPFH